MSRPSRTEIEEMRSQGFITIREAAKQLGVHKNTILNRLLANRYPGKKINGTHYVSLKQAPPTNLEAAKQALKREIGAGGLYGAAQMRDPYAVSDRVRLEMYAGKLAGLMARTQAVETELKAFAERVWNHSEILRSVTNDLAQAQLDLGRIYPDHRKKKAG